MPEPRIQGISAVVCNFNGERYLEECLGSVLEQGADEVLVVDDASTDGSLDLVRRRFPDVQVLELARNSGPSAVRNAGMRAARHRWILAVDNDAVLRPDVLARLRAALEEHPEYCIAQTRNVLYDEPERIHYDGAAFHYVGLLALRNSYAPVSAAAGEGIVEADALIGICALMDRDVVLSSGGYDEAFFYLSEDFELSYRLKALGFRLASVEDAVVLHRGGTAGLSYRGGSYPERRVFLASRNRWRILAKCYASRTLVVAAPGILVYELAWLGFVLASGNLRSYLAGKRDLFRQARELWSERLALQASRTVPDRELLVGGPLTPSPSLVASGRARLLNRVLDALLRAWWALARWLSG